MYGAGTGAVASLAEATDGQIPIGDTAGVPILATITPGDGIDITTAAGSITIATDVKANGGLVIDTTELTVDLGCKCHNWYPGCLGWRDWHWHFGRSRGSCLAQERRQSLRLVWQLMDNLL